ncbi:MAG: hypoxanthine phosphoribosyltransferase [Armatimonadetes bacterium]|nr:hypoxanthine phosphoribosyltransferase [Armatimonadota bacterium]
MKPHLEVLITEEQIAQRVKEMASEIRAEVGPEPLILLCVLKGAFPFLADLSRALDGDVRVDFVQTSSYAGGRSSSGAVRIVKDHEIDITGHHVVIVEDIVDTGLTLAYLRELLSTRQPKSLRVASFLSKPEAHQHENLADFIGFEIPKKFVVGYGLDDGELYRNLPYVAVLSESAP